MLKLQNQAPSELETALRSISVTKILKEQDEAAVITIIASQLKRLIRLYQIPNVAGNEVELADWIYENYKYEEFALVYSVLKNPPATDDKNWRLTPDTIRTWMAQELENAAVQRENEHQRMKSSHSFAPIEGLEEIYKQVRLNAINKHQTSEEIRKMKRDDLTRRFQLTDVEAVAKKRDEDYLKK